MHRGRFLHVLGFLGTLSAFLGFPGRAAAQATGACCVRASDGTIHCVVVTALQCFNQHGIYRGDGTTCSATTCAPPVTGSCCLAGGFCIQTSSSDCASHGGTYGGDGTTCANANCPAPTGACCVRAADGTITCSVVTRSACYNAHGLYRGDNTTCDASTCTPPATRS